MKPLSPIALFVYNRPEHTRKTVEALRANTLAAESELYIFSDGAKGAGDADSVKQVRDYIRTVGGFKKIGITERSENWGLSKSIISGVTEIVNKYGKVTVLEDDLVTSPHFLKYMNDGLDAYENESRVASIHGFVYPIKEILPETFFLRGADCWGWATWRRAWNMFEPDGKKLLAELEAKKLIDAFDFGNARGFSAMLKRQIAGENDSWAIRWHTSAFLADKLTLYPGRTLVDNIGQGDGTHKGNVLFRHAFDDHRPVKVGKIAIEENREAWSAFARFFKFPNLKNKIWKIF